MGVTVRAAVVDDAAEIGRVQVEVWRQAYDGLMRSERLAAMDPVRIGGLWGERLAAPPPGQRTWIALEGEELVGFATAGPSGEQPPAPDQRLYAINLLARSHRSGLADALLHAVVEPGPCSLWVVEGNARAIAFYERHGFVAHGTTQDDEALGVTERRMVRAG